jgi:hypothetical protein
VAPHRVDAALRRDSPAQSLAKQLLELHRQLTIAPRLASLRDSAEAGLVGRFGLGLGSAELLQSLSLGAQLRGALLPRVHATRRSGYATSTRRLDRTVGAVHGSDEERRSHPSAHDCAGHLVCVVALRGSNTATRLSPVCLRIE